MTKLMPDGPVSQISGVGPTREKQLQRLGIFTLRDLVYHFPRFYEERGNVLPLAAADTEANYGFILTVASEPKSFALKRGLTITKFRAFDETGAVEISFFNAPFVKDTFHTGSQFRFWGRLSLVKRSLQLTNPKYEPYVEGVELAQFVPIYPLTSGINSKFIEKIMRVALEATLPDIKDPLPESVRLSNKLPTLSYALKNVHFPADAEALAASLKRLAFDEMLYFGISISKAARQKSKGVGIRFAPCDIKPLLALLPYELTSSQKETVNDIYKDTVIGVDGKISPMARIVVGDVGSGKTICATIAMYIAAKSGYQSALMAPTEILARQHYNDLKRLYSALGVEVELLLGSTTQKEKRRIYEAVSNGSCQVLIGTHAIISDKVEFADLGLIITDEQHRFGVNQRAVLKDRVERAHMLVMSATPIPRTLALAMYGDLDVSRIKEMPKGRLRVDTFVVDESYRARLLDFVKNQVLAGGQCYVVCPSIEPPNEEEENAVGADAILNKEFATRAKNMKNAVEHAEFLRQKLGDIEVACLHGKMKAQEKDEIMRRFASGEVSVLVSTTVIEVGVNVPNASLMVIENAERFGLSQLHQLRGRVGRGTRKSYCVLVAGTRSEKSDARLDVMKTTYDGFEIAEKDLLLRGPGDFFSSADGESLRQSGGFEFKLATMCDDTDLFTAAFSAAKALVSDDPELEKEENQRLRVELERYLAPRASTIS